MFTIDLANLDGASGFSIPGVDSQDLSGFSVAGAGDFNGDGFEDLIVGAYGGDATASLSGETYVIFGKSASFGQLFNVGGLDGTDGFRIDGVAASDLSGRSVSSAGDINNDGFDDLLIGASGATGIGGANSGESYVVFGQAASLGPIFQLSGLDGANGFELEGAATGDQTGTTVNEAGDFNGDGIDDFLVTAPNANRTATTDGAVFVVFGGAAFAASANIDQLDGTDGFRLTGLDNFESIGSGAPSFGDVNGDGLADIIIGAPQADVVGGDSGAAYVVFGTTSPLAASQSVSFLDGADGFRVTGTISGDNLGRATGAGDINGDGFDDIIVSAPNREDGLTDQGVTAVIFGKAAGFGADQNINALNGADGFRINGVSSGDRSGFAATAAGDVNADGFEDILLASGQADGGAGEGYIIFGSASFGSEIELGALDATQGSIITGGQVGDQVARYASGIGDLDGDGFADIALGAPFADTNAGETFIINGFDSGAVTNQGTLGDDVLAGTAGADVFVGDLGNDVFAGAGGADAMFGGIGDDILISGDSTFQRIDGGTGADTLRLTGASQAIDFSAAGDQKVTDVEIIDLQGAFNTVTLDTLSVLALSTTSNSITINGRESGTLALADVGSWTAVNTTNEFVTLQSGSAELLVSVNVALPAGIDPPPLTSIDLAALDGSDGFRLLSSGANDDGGFAVRHAGDVNGDGFADVLVGAPLDDGNAGASTGATFLAFGSALPFAEINLGSGGNSSPRFVATTAADYSGESVGGGGDFNGDGFADFVIGAAQGDAGGLQSGEVYVVFGKAGSFLASQDLDFLDGADGFRVDGPIANGQMGAHVSFAGDVNGDGFDDIVIGSELSDIGGANSGQAHLIFGTADNLGASFSVDVLDGSNGLFMNGLSSGDRAGRRIEALGDINGDDIDDFGVGVQLGDANGTNSGEAYVVFGNAAGLGSSLNFGALDGADGFIIPGAATGDALGTDIERAGDVNGDGIADFIVSANSADSAGANIGETYVIFGTTAAFTATFDVGGLDGADGFRVDGAIAGEFSGTDVAAAGDINGDGFDDLIITADQADPNGDTQAGQVYVVFGQAAAFDAAISAGALDGADGFRIDGVAAGDRLGTSASGAGDVNGDGFDDIIVGAPEYGAGNEGGAFVVLGFDTGGVTLLGGNGNNNLVGSGAIDVLVGGRSNDLLQGLGGQDVLRGGEGDDVLAIGDTTFRQLSGGLGDDFVQLTGTLLTVDLTAAGDQNINEVEGFTFTGANNTLVVDKASVLGLSGTSNTITLDGAESATATLTFSDAGWLETDRTPGAGTRTFTNGEATIIADEAITLGAGDPLVSIDLSALDGADGFRIDGNYNSAQVGLNVGDAGDFNGDGFADFVVGSPRYSVGSGFYYGEAHVVFGNSAGIPASFTVDQLDGANGFTVRGQGSGDTVGFASANIGDFNGDGLSDIVIGGPSKDGDAGGTYVIFGAATAPAANLSTGALDGSVGFELTPAVTGKLGQSVSSAGDVNADGFADIIIGAPEADVTGGTNNGETYIVFGTDAAFGSTFNLGALDATQGVHIEGQSVGGDGDLSGFSVSAAGDINGDGIDDVLIGAPLGDPAGAGDGGETYVLFGNAAGFGTTKLLADLDGADGFRIDGTNAQTLFGQKTGYSVSDAGDVNGDGFSDIIIGMEVANSPYNIAGRSFVIFGQNGGFGAAIDVDDLDGADGFVVNGVTIGDLAGRSVSSAGDFNGDGFDDLLIGARYVTVGGDSEAGQAYILFGKSTAFSLNNNLAGLDATEGVRIDGIDLGDNLGRSVHIAGDVNGDGFDDVVVGAPYADGASSLGGEAFLIFGFNNDLIGNAGVGDAAANALVGAATADILIGGGGDDTLTGAGGLDVLRGGEGDDIIDIASTGFQRIDGGLGDDTLRVSGASQTLDFTTPGNEKVAGIETLALTGGNAAVTVDTTSVLNLSDTSNTLRVTGEATDTLTIADAGSWTATSSTNETVTLTNGQATLVVDLDVVLSPAFVAPAPSVIDLGTLDGAEGFSIYGANVSDESGRAVSNAGDVNGDGFEDFIIGAHYESNGPGSAYVVFGKAGAFAAKDVLTSLDGSDGFRLTGINNVDQAGLAVSGVGDFNNDGFDDIVVGAPTADVGGTGNTGEAYVVFGQAAGFAASISAAALDGSNGVRFQGDSFTDEVGYAVSSAGDFNGDGIDDLLVAARFEDPGGVANAGITYLVFGQEGAFAATKVLNTLDASEGIKFNGVTAQDFAGQEVTSAGDFNGDGFDDILIAAPASDVDGADRGVTYLVLGHAAPVAADFNLSALDGTDGTRFTGVRDNGQLGLSVSGGGDLNSDGFSDLIISAPRSTIASGVEAGETFFVFGSVGVLGATTQVSSFEGSEGILVGTDANDRSGNSVSNVGDVNGDGFDDAVIGTYFGDPSGQTDAGEAYVVFGNGAGPVNTINLDTLDGADGFRIDGVTAADLAAHGVSGGGDINGDGFDDILIGAPFSDTGASNGGETYIIFGADNGAVTQQGDAGDNTLTGNVLADTILGGQGDDTLIGAGGLDALIGGSGDDILDIAATGARRLDGGTGVDTLRVSGAGQSLDFVQAGNNGVFDIEAIDLSGGTATVLFDALSVLDVSSTTNRVTITGDATSTLTLSDAGWIISAVDATTNKLTNGLAEIVIDADIVVSAALENQQASIAVGGLDGTDGFRLVGAGLGDFSGASANNAGDINNDGFDDLIIGATTASPGGRTSAGETFVVFGAANGFGPSKNLNSLDGSDGFKLNGLSAGDQSGRRTDGGGDFNGDGIADVLITARYAAPGGDTNAGESYVLFGKATAFANTIELSALDGADGFRLDGIDAQDRSGDSIGNLGDINGDGVDDFIIGAGTAAPGGVSNAGEAYVVFGSALGFSASLGLETLDGSNGFRIDGSAATALLGRGVDAAGDVNGDGINDILVGSHTADVGGVANAGETYVIFGSESAFAASISVTDLDGADGFTLQGIDISDYAGKTLGSAGDINGDGFADVAIGADSADPGGVSRAGEGYVVFGKAAGFTADISLADLDGTDGFRVEGGDIDSDFFSYSIREAGDFNGDGFGDLIVGTRSPAAQTGDAFLLFGKAAGFGAVVDLQALDGADGIRLDGVNAGDKFGFDVSGAGDVNGDGFDDIIASAPYVNSNTGHTFVIFGFNSGDVTQEGTDGADTLSGSAGVADVLVGGLGEDALIGSGGQDVLRGGGGDDTLAISDNTFQAIAGGTGTDTIRVDGVSQNLAFDGAGDEKVKSIEAVDLNGTGSTLTIDRLTVLQLSETTNTLTVTGDATTTLDLVDNGWTLDAAGGGTQTFINDGATVIVDDVVTVALANTAPVAADDAFTEDEDVAINGDVLADNGNGVDADVDGDTLTISATPVTDVANGTLVLNTNGTFTYTPDADFNGTDSFVYTLDDGNGGTDTGTVTLTVNAVNDAPTLLNNTVGGFDGLVANSVSRSSFAEFPSETVTVDFLYELDSSNLQHTLFSYAAGAETQAFVVSLQDDTLRLEVNGLLFSAVVAGADDLQQHHIAVTWNSATGAVEFFFDGVSAATGTVAAAETIAASGTLVLGQDQDVEGGGFSASEALIGGIGPVNIHNRVLSGTEIADAANGIVDISDADIVAAYRFNAADQTYLDVAAGNDLVRIGVIESRDGPNQQLQVLEDGILRITGLTAADVDAGALDIEVALGVVGAGSITLADTTNVVISGGANGTDAFTITGETTAVNAALATLSFDPGANANGTVSLSATVSDLGNSGTGGAQTENLTIAINVAAVNDNPVAAADAFTGNEDTDITGNVLADNGSGVDSDVDGDTLTISATPDTDVANGTLVLNTNGTFTYTPDANFNGTDSFVYTLEDGNGGIDTGTVSLTVNAVNDDPVAAADAFTGSEDLDITGNVLNDNGSGVDADIDGDGLTISATPVTDVANGTLVLNTTGTFTYTPDANFNGTDSFVYTLDDGNGGTDTATVTLTVNAVNDDPVAAADAFTGNEDTDITGNVLNDNGSGADADVDGDAPTISATPVTDVANGTLVLNTNGTFTYTPDANFNGTDSFVYTLDDGNGGTDTATVTLTVNAVNDDPVAAADAFIGDEDFDITGNVLNDNGSGVDADVEGDALTISATPVTDVANGTLVLNTNGTFTYTPDANFNGVDSFVYTLDDGNGGTDTATVTLTVNAVDDDPVAAADAFTGNEDADISGNVLNDNGSGADADVDGDALTVSATPVTDVANGTLVLNTNGTFTYTPDANFNGTDSFVYTLDDGNGGTDTATVTLTVNAVNDEPTIVDVVRAAPFEDDATITVDLLEDAADVDGDTLNIANLVLVSGDDSGVTVSGNTLDVDPTAYNGLAAGAIESIRYRYDIEDGNGGSVQQIAIINVRGLNDAPVAAVDVFTGNEDTDITGNVLADNGDGADNDVDGDALTVATTPVTDVANGTLVLNANGTFTYTPDVNFNGTDSFIYTLDDGNGGTDTATVILTVNAVNDDPVAFDDVFTGNEDTDITGNVLADNGAGTDSDVDGDTLTVSTTPVTDVANGTLVLNANGTFTYTPDANFNGTDSFVYTLQDGNGGTDTGTVTFTVNALNDPPTVGDVVRAAPFEDDDPITVDLLDSAVDVDGDTLTVANLVLVSGDDSGVTVNGNTLDVDPSVYNGLAAGAIESIRYRYDIEDGNGGTVSQIAIVNVRGLNDAPVAAADAFTGAEDADITGNVLADNGSGVDSDVDGDTLTISATPDTDVANGTLVLNTNGTFTYTPDANFSGTDSFVYTLQDGNGGTDTGTVTLTVTAINDAPTVVDVVRAAPFEDDAAITVDLLDNAVDVDGDTLNIANLVLISGDDSGVTINGNSLDVDPSAYNGLSAGAIESIRYRYDIEDGNGGTVEQIAIINVRGLNDAPVALNDLFTTDEDNAVSGDVLADNGVNPDRDADDADVLTVFTTPVTDVANGTLVLNANGTFTYTPDADFNGEDRFVYTLDDGNGGTDTASVRVTVNAVNDAPVAAADAFAGDEDTDITGNLLADNGSGVDSDVDGDPLTISATPVTDVANGTLVLNTNGTFTYTPDANFNGTDSFVYTLEDGNGGTDTATVSLTVNPVNDAPVALNDLFTTDEDTAVSGDVLADNGVNPDRDIDGDSLTVSATPVTDVANGTLVLNADGTFTYTPDADFNGTDRFVYTLDDGNGGTDTASVTITVNAVADAPTVVDVVRAAPFEDDAPISVDLLDGAVDVDGDALNISGLTLVSGDDSGVTVNGNTLDVDPSAYNGLAAGAIESIRYRYDIEDGNGGIVSQIAIINVRGLNDAPVALNDLFTTDEDNAVSGDVLADNGVNLDRDLDGDLLTISTTPVTDVANGTLVLNANGTFTYTPDANFNGVDRFVYTLDDGNGGTDTASVRITVNAVNDAPVAVADTFAGDEDTVFTGNVLEDNGSGAGFDVDGDALTVSTTVLRDVFGGDLTLNANGTFTYTPDANFSGRDFFEYEINDGNGGTDTAFATLLVNPVNDDPVAADDAFTGNENADISGNVLDDNGAGVDVDIDGDALTVATTPVTDVANGALVLNANGTFTYTPNANFSGTDSFVYTLDDGNGGTDTATVTLTVNDVNEAPIVGGAVRASPTEDDAPIIVNLLDGASDADGDALNVVNLLLIAGDDSGVTVNGNTLEIDPSAYNALAAGALETIRYRYDVSDGSEATRQSAIINIRGLNDSPTVSPAITVNISDDGRTFTGNLLDGAVDPEGDTITINQTPVDDVDNGALVIEASGAFTYTPDEGFGGQDSFVFEIQDGNGGTDTGLITLVVAANETVVGQPGDDVITGDGTTRVSYETGATGPIFGDLRSGIIRGDESVGRDTVSGIFEIRGTQFNDTLFGSDVAPNGPPPATLLGSYESFEGMSGADVIIARGGLDRANYSQSIAGVNVDLSNGIATNDGFDFADSLFDVEGIGGSQFDDILVGDEQNNFFQPNRGSDAIDGGAGFDLVLYGGALGDINIDLRADRAVHANGDIDALVSIEFAETGAGDDIIIGDGDINALAGNDGDDRIVGLAGDDLILGGKGNDRLFANSGADAVSGEDGDDRLIGGFGDDVLSGGAGNDFAIGESGDDELDGGAGDDLLFGNSGADTLLGGDGDDELSGGEGIDTLNGGLGNDIYVVEEAGDVILDAGGNDLVKTNIDFTLGADLEALLMFRIAGDLTGFGNGLDNFIVGSDGDNTLSGEAGDDELIGRGGDDALYGKAGSDILDGNDGVDRLRGGDDDDQLTGGAGNDSLSGDAGADLFIFGLGSGIDTLTDFSITEDVMDVTAYGFADFAALSLVIGDVNGRAQINLNGQTDVLRLDGVAAIDLTADDFLI